MTRNPQIDLAAQFVEHTGANIFLTGRAGTGKTTFLHRLRERSPKRMVVVAPTGVAAINAGGVTIHSLFQIPFGVWLPGIRRVSGDKTREVQRFSKNKIAIIKSIDLLVIDEISMVRADLLDAVDEVLRRYRDRTRPFGGVQLLMIGDVQQLAPVVKDEEWMVLRDHYASPYFFDSLALRQAGYTSIELKHIYRQSDRTFIDLLAAVRENRIDRQVLEALNARHIKDFDPPQSEGYITLTSHNATARSINHAKLEQLDAPQFTYHCTVEGDFPPHLYPVESELTLKEGAQVMFTKNDHQPEHRYVNGTIGTVTYLDDDRVEVLPAEADQAISLDRADWENLSYSIDPESRQIVERIDGMFTQYPLKTAWAITIHKSQGLTFDRTVIDAADSFSHGQVYVALSRCRTLEGIVLRTPLSAASVINDGVVSGFSDYVEQNQPSEEHLQQQKRQYFETVLAEQFDFDPIRRLYADIARFAEQHLWRLYPKTVEQWLAGEKRLQADIMEVALRFRAQASRLTGDDYATNPMLAERITKAAEYFQGKCAPMVLPLKDIARLEVDSKEHKKQLTDLCTNLLKQLQIKLATLSIARNAFSVKDYLEARAQAIAAAETSPKDKFKTPKEEKPKKLPAGVAAQDDLQNPELFEILRVWRYDLSKRMEVSAFVIASTKTLIAICNALPRDSAELKEIKGVGKAFLEKYGAAVLTIIDDYVSGRLGISSTEIKNN